MFLDRELCRQYLSGQLTPKENYQIENKLLENDFGYDAFDGLAQIGDDLWHKQLEQTEARISKEFGIRENKGKTISLSLGLTGMLVAVMAAWFYFSPSGDTLDLTSEKTEESARPTDPILEEEELLIVNPESAESSSPKPSRDVSPTIIPESPDKHPEPKSATPEIKAKEPQNVSPTKSDPVDTHITVGRIVDTKGIPVVEASVSHGKAADTTDKSGYYALKVSDRGINVRVTHLSIPYVIEIDSHQNWEIVLDIANQKVIDYYPINAANRFK